MPDNGQRIDAYLGLDIGSVGTKVVVIDDAGDVVYSIFTRTQGRPIEVVGRCLKETARAVGRRVRIRAVGTTGSGRELIGELVGADSINDEITAHKTGAVFVADRLLDRRPDTIFEIGGQDSKYIRLHAEGGGNGDGRDGGARGNNRGQAVVVDFAMNEACAAGTGSFLEERAEELGVSIKDEFAELALRSRAPIKLGERCTVFMERDVAACMQRGARREDVIAGLAYSVVHNYINRVVRGRSIGECIFFQGGTAYNDAVAAAFAAVTGKTIIVPPHNALLGAIGAALLARDKLRSNNPARRSTARAEARGSGSHGNGSREAASGEGTRFRGFDLGRVEYGLREFTCHGCGNRCAVQEFDVDGEKTYWGDKCSERFRKRAKTDRKPVIPDLMALRQELLAADDDSWAQAQDAPRVCDGSVPSRARQEAVPTANGKPLPYGRGSDRALASQARARPRLRIGLPLAMYGFDLLPLWRTFFRECGLGVEISSPTNRQTVKAGLEWSVAEPCFPIIVAHGHAAELVKRGVDGLWLPNIVSARTQFMDNESHVCPWGQTLPFVLRQTAAMQNWPGRLLCPTIRFREGPAAVRKVLVRVAADLGVSRATAERAFDAGWTAWQRFRRAYEQAGLEAMQTLVDTGERGIVLLGRPYNIHDIGVSLAVGRKLRDLYGVNVIPLDALPLSDVDVTDINDNMYWDYGRRILAAAKLVGKHSNLDLIYITNFKCGPDSFIKGFVRRASGKPFLTLQFDGHSNDAGLMTRCEAYLDSKGILRCWSKNEVATDHATLDATAQGRIGRQTVDQPVCATAL